MKLSITSWSLHRHFNNGMSLENFITTVREKFHITFVELCQIHFKSTEPGYLDSIKSSLANQSVKISLLPIDCAPAAELDSARREKNINKLLEWFDVAVHIGAPAVRVNTGGNPSESKTLDTAIESYTKLAKEAEDRGLNLLIENHGGISANPKQIVQILKTVKSPVLKTCPDLGNFCEEIRYQGLQLLRPYAYTVHIKTYTFDKTGTEVTYNFPKAIEPFKDYKGFFCIEYEGKEPQEDEMKGIQLSINLLERTLKESPSVTV